MERTTEYINLKKVVHRVYCDECNVELESGDVVYMTYPPKYPYFCPQCKKKYCFKENYPWSEIVGTEVNNKGFAVSLT